MIFKCETESEAKALLLQQGFLAFTRQQFLTADRSEVSFCLPEGVRCHVLDIGVLQFEPARPDMAAGGTDLILSCGVHGNETGPIEMLDRIVSQILNSTTKLGNRLLCIIGNPKAVAQQQRFSQENLNRLFNAGHKNKSSYEAGRAKTLERHVDSFFVSSECAGTKRVHYDLHTAIRASKYPQFVVYPYADGADFDTSALAFFKHSGINTVLLSHQPSHTFSYFSSHVYQAESFTVELGRVRPFGENDLDDFDLIQRNLLSLIAGEVLNLPDFDNNDFHIFAVKHELLKQSEQFVLNLAADVPNFHQLPNNYVLTDDTDGGYQVQHDDEAIVFPNAKVPVGQRVGLIIHKTEL